MVPLLGGTADAVSDEDTAVAHLISLLVVGGLLLLFTLWTAYTARRRKGSGCWHKWGPTVMVAVATVLVNVDAIHNVLLDHDLCSTGGGSQSSGWDDICVHITSWAGLACTYSGFALLSCGSLWNANIVKKLAQAREQWAKLRAPELCSRRVDPEDLEEQELPSEEPDEECAT